MRRRLGLLALAVPAAAALAALLPGSTAAADGLNAPAIHVQIWQAALIAFGYYLANSPWLFGLAFFTLYRPLVAGLLVGIILGDPGRGTLVGAAINVPYLGFISAGGNLPADASFAGWVGTTVALAGNLDPAQAIPIAFALGLLGTLIFYVRMAADSVFAHWVDARAERADLSGVALMNWLPGQTLLFVISFIPVFFFALNGATAVRDALDRMPLWVVDGLAIAGGILPAIGIALNMRFIFRGAVIPYFFLGFILITVTGGNMSIVVVAVIGLALAYLHLTFVQEGAVSRLGAIARQAPTTAEGETQPAESSPVPPTPRTGVGAPARVGTAAASGAAIPAGAPAAAVAARVQLRRSDILRSWITWSFFSHANYNYERLQGTGFAHAMVPIIRRLYSSEGEIRAALLRHLVFFNTEPNFGNVVHGTVIAMEEQRANGAPIDDDAINSVKSGLMGPLAGIGDTLSQSTLTPILLAVGIGIAGGTAAGTNVPTLSGAGNPLGAIFYTVSIAVVIVTIGYVAWMQGYLRGRAFVTDVLRSGTIDRLLVGASVLGNIVLGALAAKVVTVFLAPTISVAGAQMNLQANVLDPIFPGLLTLGLVLLTWWALRRTSPLVLLVIYLAASIVAAYPLFGPGRQSDNDFSYRACTSAVLHPYYPCGPAPSPTLAPTVAPSPSAAPAASPSASGS